MFEKVAFKRDHVIPMLAQEKNADNRAYLAMANFDVLEAMSSFTGLLNGKAAVCGGVVPYWEGRGYLWTVFDETTKDCFIPVFRGIKSFLEAIRPMYNRLEIAVPCEFEVGIRRAKMLGFSVECERAVKFLPDGKDCTLFVMLGGK